MLEAENPQAPVLADGHEHGLRARLIKLIVGVGAGAGAGVGVAV